MPRYKKSRRSRSRRKSRRGGFCNKDALCPDTMVKEWMKCGSFDTALSECRMRRGAAMNTNMSDKPYKRLDGGRMWYDLNLDYFKKAKSGKKKKEYAGRLDHFVKSARAAEYKGIKQYPVGWWNADYENIFNNEVQTALGKVAIAGTPGLRPVGQVGQGRRRKSRRKKRRKSKKRKSRRRSRRRRRRR